MKKYDFLKKIDTKLWIIVILLITNIITGIFLTINLVTIPKFKIYSAITLNYVHEEVDSLEIEHIDWIPYNNEPILIPSLDSELCGDAGNLYAPDILIENGKYKMWYGAQNKQGHDQIHFADSDDGIHWTKYGVVIPNGANNHVNDPSVVKVNDSYYMFYTTAPVGEMDVISLANSTNGINWTIIGNVFLPSEIGNWDSFKVGRPTVIYEDDIFKMWYDGMEADPSDPSKYRPGTGRHVGYATSVDGINWIRYPSNPIVLNCGAVDVENISGTYVMVIESGQGVYWCHSSNEIDFGSASILFKKTGLDWDKFGHVTPFILKEDEKWIATYVGVTTDACWCQNRIGVWYPFLNVSLFNANDVKLMPSMRFCSSKTSIEYIFEDTIEIKNNLLIKTDGSWDCIFKITDNLGIDLLIEQKTIYHNPNYLDSGSDAIKNKYLYDRSQNLLIHI